MFTLGHIVIEDGTRFNITHIVMRDGKMWLHAEGKNLTRPAGRIGWMDVYGEDDVLLYRCESDSVLGAMKRQRWVPFELSLFVHYTVKPDDVEPSWRRP